MTKAVKAAQLTSIVAAPRLEACAAASSNDNRQLAITWLLKGPQATTISKDLKNTLQNWQVQSPEQLHQQILDLLSFVRQHKLQIEFALTYLLGEQLLCATYQGAIVLRRRGQSKVILHSEQAINMVVGRYQDEDLLMLVNQSATQLAEAASDKLRANLRPETIASQLSVLQQNLGQIDESSLTLVSYQEAVLPPTLTRDQRWRMLAKRGFQNGQQLLTKIPPLLKKITQLAKKIVDKLKKQDRKKVLLVIAGLSVISAVILISSAVASAKQSRQLAELNHKLLRVDEQVADLEQLLLRQPLQARAQAGQLLEELTELAQQYDSKAAAELLRARRLHLQQLSDNIASSNALDQLAIIHDLDDFLAQQVLVAPQGLLLLETNGQQILLISNDGQRQLLPAPTDTVIRDWTLSEQGLLILGNGLHLLDLNAPTAGFTQIKTEGDSDKAAEFISSYGPYIYLFNREKRNVYRYTYQKDELSQAIGWIVDKKGINFELVSDLLVDGDLWLGMRNGQLIKLNRGAQVDFALSGLSQTPQSALLLAAYPEQQRLAALEKQAKRLLVLTNEGQLISEINSNELAGVTHIAFATDGASVYAVSGSVVYRIDFNPLY